MNDHRTNFFKLVMLPLLLVCSVVQAQNVAINADGSKADPNAILDIKSNNKGLLIPRISSAARLKIPNTQGLIVYDVNTNSFWYNTGKSWQNMGAPSAEALSIIDSAWLLTGNSGTVDGTHFLGTRDNVPLNIRVNNQRSGRIDPINRVTLLGYQAGANITTAKNNTAIGAGALFLNSTGFDNTVMGADAMQNNSGGFSNTAIGRMAMFNNTNGAGNTAVGNSALISNRGNDNVGVGSFSGLAVNGSRNTAVGNWSQGCCGDVGNENTSVGYISGYGFRGSNNVAVGAYASSVVFTGDRNTVIGSHSFIAGNVSGSTILGSNSIVERSNSTAIGAGVIVNVPNKVRIGNAAVTVIEGQVPFTSPSDGRFKFGVQEDVKGLDFIMNLRPVTYYFDTRRFDQQLGNASASDEAYDAATHIRRTGFIAQEVEDAAKRSGYDFSGVITPNNERKHYSLSYDAFVVPLVKAMQEQQQIINEQNQKIADLQKEMEEIKKLLKSRQ
jgi:hypothetical protein